MKKQIIYTTRLLKEISDNFNDKRNPWYRQQYGMRAANLLFEYTQSEILEYARCYHDPIYFFETYCYIQTPMGLAKIVLRDYQKKIIEKWQQNRFNIEMHSRQTGSSIMITLIMLHSTIFFYDKSNVIITPTIATGIDHMNKFRTAYQNLPFFLQPGIRSWDKNKILFDNGSCIRLVSAASKYPAVGYQIHNLFLDNFAFFEQNSIEHLSRAIFPAICAHTDSKITIASSPNGYNKFYEMFTNAERGANDFIPTRTYWWQVAGRDELWKEREIANHGEDAFNRFYEFKFK